MQWRTPAIVLPASARRAGVILILEGKRKVMGSFAVNPWVKILGWAATAAMAVAVAAMVLA